jgi:hypothetical protein
MFTERLNKIIAQGRGPIGLIKIIKNSNEDTIMRFLTGEKEIEGNDTGKGICQPSEVIFSEFQC